MSSAFPYETIALNKTFFGRSDEIKKINKFIKESNNLVIISKRRVGKSSLINEIFRTLDKSIIALYVDIFDMTSAEEFASLLIKGLANSQKGDIKTVLKRLGSIIKRTRLEPTINPDTLEYSIKPNVTSLTYEEILEDFFNSINELSKKQKVVIAIDEFQQISTIKDKKIDATFRKYMQNSENISFIFLGSKRHTLNNLFEYKTPLFEMATSFELKTIKIEETYEYIKKYLKIELEQLEYIYELSDGETKLMQHIFHILHTTFKNKTITKDMIDSALNEILDYKTVAYRGMLDTFTINQKKAFKIILKHDKNLFSNDVLKEQSLSKNIMQSALNSLFEREIIDKEENVWFLPDRTLELWGRKKFI